MSETTDQQRLSLYRSLLSLIKAPRSEEEMIRFVVTAIHDHFGKHRVCLSRFISPSKLKVIYSCDAGPGEPMTGKVLDISLVPSLMNIYRSGRTFVANDLRKAPEHAASLQALADFGGSPSRVDVPFLDADGGFGIVSLSSETPQDWDQDTVDLLKEVSELVSLLLREVRTREKLRNSETLFRQFAENVQVVFWMTDPMKNDLIYVSPAYETIWGRTMESLYREPLSFLEAIHPDDRERVRTQVFRQAVSQYEEIYRVVRPDGSIRWVKDRGFGVRNQDGNVFRIVGIAEDITVLREAQERLEATQAQVISNAKFAALGEMASGIAHEINNPLAVIHGLTVQLQELFRNKNASTTMVLDSLGSMEKMANRIAAIVKGLRTFSRQTDGDPMSPADLVAIAQETLAMCEAKLHAAGILVTLNVPLGRVTVRCRSSEISQVLLNLLSNAFDAVSALRERTILLRVETANGKARLSVEDSGLGIEESRRDRIFQPFYTTKEVGKGTGLGLSISKGIVEAHGGRLFLDTSSPKTRFVVELPSSNE
jgi:two-component system cell cycle sensor histidine kinase/response regulator CckA